MTSRKGPGLTREAVIERAMALADAGGLDTLTMRSLADALGVQAMSLYHHVANKEALLDGLVDAVFGEVPLPQAGGDWREELGRRAHGTRGALRRHPWAVTLLESRTSPGPATMRHHDAVLGTLRAAGFSLAATGHAYVLLDAFVYGFAIQEATLPFDTPDEATAVAGPLLADIDATELPHLVEFMTEHVLRPGYDFGAEFDVGLEAVLDAIAVLRQ